MGNSNSYIDIKKEIDNVKKEKAYEYLVLSGGGTKGICFCGALKELDKMGVLYDNSGKLKIKGICGTSVGSIIASMFAIGYNPDEMIKLLKDIDLTKIMNDNEWILHRGYNLIKKYGECPGEYIENYVAKCVKNKVGDENYTIKQLYEDTGIELTIITTNLNRRKAIYLNPQHINELYCNIPIKKAVRMSMSIPFAFEPVQYSSDDNKIDYFVDGGTADNYAIHVFDGKFPGDRNAILNIIPPNPKVLGLKIITNDNNPNEYYNIDGYYQYGYAFIDLFLKENENRIMTPLNKLRTVFIKTPDYPLMEFKLTEEQQEELIKRGKLYIKEYFN